MKKRIALICLLLVGMIMNGAYAQSRTDSFFKTGDKISFIGNSITHSGDFHHYILVYYATRFPELNISVYNLGIKGDNANSFLRRMDADIIPKKANWSIIMAGMNDVNRSLYAAERQGDTDIPSRKERALSDYRNYYETVIQRLLKTKTKIILQKPSIYDQTGDLPVPNLMGVNDALKKCTGIIDELAKKYKLQVIDYWTIMAQLNKQLQQKDPKATIVGNDRVHPGPVGNFVMAHQFLKSTSAPTSVSAIEIENGAVKNSSYVVVKDLSVKDGTITFKAKEESLPFPMPQEAEPALALVPFAEELNKQSLKIGGLTEGSYTLTIDGTFIGNFTAQNLENGINLSNFKNTPQYKQAVKVLQQAILYRNTQRKVRDLKFVEFSYLPENLWNGDFNGIKAFMDNYLSFMQTSNDARYPNFKKVFDDYLKDKPSQRMFEKQIDSLAGVIYTTNRPKEHTFQISKSDLNMPDRSKAPFGVNLAGAEFAHNKIPGIYAKDYIYPTIDELDYFKSKGMTLIRIPFLWERLQHELGGELDQLELQRLMTIVDAARERKLWVILDMHNYGRRYVNGTREIIDSENLPIAHVADAWRKIATEFKGKDNIWGYGLMNEPHDMLKPNSWFNIAQACINKIREVDQKTPIMVGGDSWSSAERWMEFSANLKNLVDPSKDLIFEVHIYFDEDASGTYKRSYDEEKADPNIGIKRATPFVKWLNENNFRGFVGEYGVPDDDPRWLVALDNFLTYLTKNNLNGTYWAAGPWWNKYRLAIEPKNDVDRPQMVILEKYNYTEQPRK
jgi:aryl-phospho-beta-D-glucosidase BglC (GH1 family)/lysophospholipase L1-like esterase